MKKLFASILLLSIILVTKTFACSVVYYVDESNGKIYVANNEDYWYDTKAYIRIIPRTKNQIARLWYGWDNFAQGGINEAGLFFDGAVTPDQEIPPGYGKPKGNLGDEILANCKTVHQALDYLEKEKIALTNAHIIFGDNTGNAAVVEWMDGERKIITISNNRLIMTNFLLSDPLKGNYPCYRYNSIEKNIEVLMGNNEKVNLQKVGNVMSPAVQLPNENESGKTGGTLYSSFINITDMEFVFVYKIDNSKITKLDLKKEFENKKKQKIKLK